MSKSDEKLLIDIPKWDKHQFGLKQSGKRPKEWIAISTNIMHDPDFFTLSLQSRMLWLCLLLHAGRVGVPFELSPSSARVLFKFKHSCDFQPLINQGFITLLQDRIGKERTRQDSCADAPTPENETPKAKQKPRKKPAQSDPNFDAFWQAYPLKVGKVAAAKEWARQPRDAVFVSTAIEDIANRVKNDRQWQSGSQFIPHARTYLHQERWNDAIQPIVTEPVRLVRPTTDCGWLELAEKHGVRVKGKNYNQLWSEILATKENRI